MHVHVYTPHLAHILLYRSASGVRGFTRETLVAITADICTRNYRQEFITGRGLPLEHPRAGTTDDVECFFSVLRDVVGKRLYFEAGMSYFSTVHAV